MLDISLEIQNIILNRPQSFRDSHRLIYEIRTFWHKPVQLASSDGRTPLILLPGLTREDVERRKIHNDDCTVVIEVYTESLEDTRSLTKKRLGVALVTLNDAIEHPHLNPVWRAVAVMDIIRNVEEGRLYVKFEAKAVPSADVPPEGKKDGSSPYFSMSSKSDPALRCPAHLVDEVKNGMKPEKPDDKFTKLEQDPAEVGAGIRWGETPDGKKVKRIRPYMMTSPDFPLQIPAVEAAEKMLRSQYENSIAPTKQNIPSSPPLFTYTPYIDKQWSSASSAQSSPSRSKNGPQNQNCMSSSMEDLISALNKPTLETKMPSYSTFKPLSTKAPLAKDSNSKPSGSKTVQTVKSQNTPTEMKTRKNSIADRPALSPKPDKTKKKINWGKSTVPGMTVTQYKPPEDSPDPDQVPRKNRIAANIFNRQ